LIVGRDHPHRSETGTLTGEKLSTGQLVVELDDGSRCAVLLREFKTILPRSSVKHIRQELAATLATDGTPGTGSPWASSASPSWAAARKEHYEEVVRLIEELVDLKVREHCEDRNHRHSS
jgi:hypothetical protein